MRRSLDCIPWLLVLSLLGTAAFAADPAPKPARMIIAAPDGEGYTQLFVLQPESWRQTQLTHETGHAGGPRVSPDGSQILFDLQGDLYVMQADGSGAKRLAIDATQGDWSPDGKSVLFARGRGFFGGTGELIVRDLASEKEQAWAKGKVPALQPRWSKKGAIAFVGPTDEKPSGLPLFVQLRLAHADGTNFRKLDQAIWSVHDPAWSPDGAQLAFAGSAPLRGGAGGIYVSAADGVQRRRLTSADDRAPVWSPDGKQLAFLRKVAEGPTGEVRHLYLVNADGSNLHAVKSAEGKPIVASAVDWR